MFCFFRLVGYLVVGCCCVLVLVISCDWLMIGWYCCCVVVSLGRLFVKLVDWVVGVVFLV